MTTSWFEFVIASEALDNPNSISHQQWADPSASPVPYYAPPPEYWGYYAPPNMEGQYWDPYSYMAYMNEMNAAYGYPPIPYPPVFSPQHFAPRYPRYHQNGSDSDEYSGYSSTDEMAYYGANFQRNPMMNPYHRQGMVSRVGTETPRTSSETPQIVVTPTNSHNGGVYAEDPRYNTLPAKSEALQAANKDGGVEAPQGKACIPHGQEEMKVKKRVENSNSVNGKNIEKKIESEDDSDTEVEDDDEDEEAKESEGLKAIKSVSDINVYNSDEGILESNDEETEQEETDEEEEEEDEEEENEELPHQLSVIFEESECSDAESVRRSVKSVTSEDDSSTATLDNDVESDGNEDIDSESSSVTVRLPLKLKFSRSANDEEVTTVIVGDSQVNKSLIGSELAELSEQNVKRVEPLLKKEEPKKSPVEIQQPSKVNQGAAFQHIETLLKEPVISDAETDDDDFEDDSDISVTFSIPSRPSSSNKVEQWRKDINIAENGSPVRFLTPVAHSEIDHTRQETLTPLSVCDVSRQHSADDLDSYLTCESDSDVSVCVSLKMRKNSPKPELSSEIEEATKTDESHSQSSSASIKTIKSVHRKSVDSGSDLDSPWTNDEAEPVFKKLTLKRQSSAGQDSDKEVAPSPKIEENGFWETDCTTENTRIGNKIEEIINATNKLIKNRPSPGFEIDIHITKNKIVEEPKVSAKEEDNRSKLEVEDDDESSEESESSEEEDDSSESSNSSNESAHSCVVKANNEDQEEGKKDVPAKSRDVMVTIEAVQADKEIIKKVVRKEESSGEEEEEDAGGESEKGSESDIYGDEEEQIIRKIYQLCVENGSQEKLPKRKTDGSSEGKSSPDEKCKKEEGKSKEVSRDNSESGGEEDDSGVTSDMSRHISDTESETSEQRKQTQYQRASTHSRLFRLLRDECDKSDGEDDQPITTPVEDETTAAQPIGALVSRRELLTLPLRINSLSDPDSLSSSSGVTSPASPTVTDRLVKELVQSLLQRKKGKRLKKLPMAKLHAAALRILQEDMDPYDTGSSAGSEDCLSPARHPVVPQHSTIQPTANTPIPVHTPYGANYYDYCDYYNTWANAAAYYGEEPAYDIIPSRAFRLLTEHANQPPGYSPGMINGLWAKCPRIPSGKNVRGMMLKLQDSVETNPSSSSEPNSPLPPRTT